MFWKLANYCFVNMQFRLFPAEATKNLTELRDGMFQIVI